MMIILVLVILILLWLVGFRIHVGSQDDPLLNKMLRERRCNCIVNQSYQQPNILKATQPMSNHVINVK